MHNNLLFVRLHYIVIIYYVITLLVIDNGVWMDLALMISTISINKQNDKISESVNYTLLNRSESGECGFECWLNCAGNETLQEAIPNKKRYSSMRIIIENSITVVCFSEGLQFHSKHIKGKL